MGGTHITYVKLVEIGKVLFSFLIGLHSYCE